jgi:ElaB/YqjD/DUF883 family membrane-anchored ribosome-binding protein
MSMQLQVLKQELPVIEFNFDEIKAALTEKLTEYSNLVVTEETVPGCKSSQKELSTIRRKLDDYRKEVKKEVKKPIDAFEDQCKELIGMVEDLKEESFKAMETQITSMNAIFNLGTPLKVDDFKYLVGEPMDRVITEITAEAKRRSDVEAAARQKAIDDQKALEEAKSKTEDFIEQQQKESPAEQGEAKPITDEDKVMEYTLKVKGTVAQLRGLKTYIKGHGIAFEKVVG